MAKKQAAVTALRKTLVQLTPELRSTLDWMTLNEEGKQVVTLAELVEGLLRGISSVNQAKMTLGLEWHDRPTRGNRSRVKKVPKKL